MQRLFVSVAGFAVLILFLALNQSLAQCIQGSPYPGSYIQSGVGLYDLDPECQVQIKVVLHVMRDAQGNGGVIADSALALFDFINDMYAEYNIQFVHHDAQNPVRFIDNALYYPMHHNMRFGVEANYSVSGALNIFIVDRDPGDLPAWSGFTFYVPYDVLFITSDAITSSDILHEIGHCFGLWHTHGASDPRVDELVTRGAGANCTIAGDFLCDTPAEPYNNGNGISGHMSGCTYLGTQQDAINPANIQRAYYAA